MPAYPLQYALMRRGLSLSAHAWPRIGLGPGHHPRLPPARRRTVRWSRPWAPPSARKRNGRDELSMIPALFEQSQALTTLGHRPAGGAHRLGEPQHRRLGRGAGPARRPLQRQRPPRRPARPTPAARGRERLQVSSVAAITAVVRVRRVRLTRLHVPTLTHPPDPGGSDVPHTRPPRPPGHPSCQAVARRSWALLAVALAAQVLVVLDISVVNTALPTIGRSLHLAGDDLQWLVTAYVMMSGGGLLLGGRVSDLLSRRGVFLTGLALFTLASLASGYGRERHAARRRPRRPGPERRAPDPLRALADHHDLLGHQQKAALALWGAVGSLGVAAGVLVGGAITTWTSWQFIFWVNAPVGIVAFLVGRRVIAKESASRPARSAFDIPGALTVIAGLATLVYVLGRYGDTRLVVGPGRHSAWPRRWCCWSSFLKLERRAAKPLFPRTSGSCDALVSGTAVMLGVTGILVGTVFLASIFMQTVLGYSALRTGLAFLPFALAITVGTVVARHLLAHVSPRAVAAAGLVLVVGAAALLSAAPADSVFAADLLPGLLGLGLGVGMVFVPGLGVVHDRHSRLPRRCRIRVPDDRSRDRRRPRRRRPLRRRQHRWLPGHPGRRGRRRSPAGSSPQPSSRHCSPSSPCSGCRRDACEASTAGMHLH